MRRFKIEVFADKAGEFRFRIVSRNGRTVAQSEGYTRRADAVRTANSIARSHWWAWRVVGVEG